MIFEAIYTVSAGNTAGLWPSVCLPLSTLMIMSGLESLKKERKKERKREREREREKINMKVNK